MPRFPRPVPKPLPKPDPKPPPQLPPPPPPPPLPNKDNFFKKAASLADHDVKNMVSANSVHCVAQVWQGRDGISYNGRDGHGFGDGLGTGDDDDDGEEMEKKANNKERWPGYDGH